MRAGCPVDISPGSRLAVAMPRTVTKVVPSKDQDEGMGARVRRSIGGTQVRHQFCLMLADKITCTSMCRYKGRTAWGSLFSQIKK